MTAKAQNYTAEMTNEIKDLYASGQSVEFIAEKFGKTVRSVVAKLSREGVYKAKEYKTKTGEKPEAKSELVAKIADKANLPIDLCDSLEKVNKQILIGLLAALNRD